MGSVGFGRARPGKPQDCSIPQVQQAVDVCWRTKPRERKTAAEIFDILSSDAAFVVPGLNVSLW